MDFLEDFLAITDEEERRAIAESKYRDGHLHREFKQKRAQARGMQEISQGTGLGQLHGSSAPKEEDAFKRAMLQEMGIGEDGLAQQRVSERRGLGGQEFSSGNAFDQYRNSRSRKYHVAAEERSKGFTKDEV